MSWLDHESAFNAAAFAAFGPDTTVLYQQLPGVPFEIQCIRLNRDPNQLEQGGSFEGLYIQESLFPSPPQVGDLVTMDGTAYVVSDIRNPNPYESNKVLVLTRQFRAT